MNFAVGRGYCAEIGEVKQGLHVVSLYCMFCVIVIGNLPLWLYCTFFFFVFFFEIIAVNSAIYEYTLLF